MPENRGIPTRSDTYRHVQSQKKVRSLKLWIERSDCTTGEVETKSLISWSAALFLHRQKAGFLMAWFSLYYFTSPVDHRSGQDSQLAESSLISKSHHEKTSFCLWENKDDQLCMCFRYMESTIPFLCKSEISSFYPSPLMKYKYFHFTREINAIFNRNI